AAGDQCVLSLPRRRHARCASIRLVTILPRIHTRPALIVLAAGLLAASGGTAVAATHLTGAGGGTARPAAMLANCPVFPANNVWNTDVSKLPADPHSAAWLRSMHS